MSCHRRRYFLRFSSKSWAGGSVIFPRLQCCLSAVKNGFRGVAQSGLPLPILTLQGLESASSVLIFGDTRCWYGTARISRAPIRSRGPSGYWRWNAQCVFRIFAATGEPERVSLAPIRRRRNPRRDVGCRAEILGRHKC